MSRGLGDVYKRQGDFHPTVTIDFYIYDGATKPQTIVFEVEEKGKFKFVSCTWNE